MKQQQGRPRRVGELIRQEIGKLITKGLKDPRIGFVSVMEVKVSPDLQFANVYVSILGDEAQRKSSLVGLRNASGWIRRELGRHLRTRVTPEIRFFPDDTLDQVYHLEEILEDIHKEQQRAPMIQIGLPEMVEELKQGERYLVLSHESPDGDAVGSVLAMAYLLRSLGAQAVHCALSDPVPRRYTGLAGAEGILRYDPEREMDVDRVVLLDVADPERCGDVAKWVSDSVRLLVVDHHQGYGPDGAVGCIDTSYAATGEMVFGLCEHAGVELTPGAAAAIYVAQITDTGGYRYSNTNARSHRIAGVLLESGIDAARICSEVFDVISRPKFELMRRVLDRVEVQAGGLLSHTWVTAQDLDECEGTREDLDGLVNYPRNIEGVQVGVLFTGLKPEVTKVSLRARDFDAARFLQAFGGGGHAAAAGATMHAPLNEVRGQILAALEESLLTHSEGAVPGEEEA